MYAFATARICVVIVMTIVGEECRHTLAVVAVSSDVVMVPFACVTGFVGIGEM